MLPRLQAEEAIALANRVAVGAGTLEPHARADVARDWARTAAPGPRVVVKASPPLLHGSGIGVRFVPKKPTSPDAVVV